MLTQVHTYNIFADYFQILITDAKLKEWIDTFTDEDIDRLLTVGREMITISTVRNMTVPFILEIHDQEPPKDFAEWQHVVEGSMNIPSGVLIVLSPTMAQADTEDISVIPGMYRLRSYARGLDTLSEDGLDGSDEYRAVLWPAPWQPLEVIKQFIHFYHSVHRQKSNDKSVSSG
jgi:hypothetical protein